MHEPADRTDKRDLRRRMLTARRRRDLTQVERAGRGLAEQVASLVGRVGTSTVAAYVSLSGEPQTGLLTNRLHAHGIIVLLPLLRDDNDLDWAAYSPDGSRPGRLGLTEPTSPPLGLAAIQSAGVICCPGLAGSVDGHRLGRGGGSYDRALARALPDSLRCLLLYDDEVLADIPTEPHDQRVDMLVTPTRILATSARRR